MAQSYAAKFSLADVCDALVGARLPPVPWRAARSSPPVTALPTAAAFLPPTAACPPTPLQEDEFGARPSDQSMLDILKQHFDCEMLEARLAPSSGSSNGGSSSGGGGEGLQVMAQHSTGDSDEDITFTVRCVALLRPPNCIRFALWLQRCLPHPTARASSLPSCPLLLHTVPRRLPPRHGAPRKAGLWVAQDVLFTQNERLRSVQRRLDACELRCPASQQFDDALAFLALAEGAKEEPPRAALHKRKQQEPPGAPVSGSAVKAARPSGNGAQPAATQQTGSTQQTQRTNASAAVEARVQRVSGRGRGRGPRAGRGRGRR